MKFSIARSKQIVRIFSTKYPWHLASLAVVATAVACALVVYTAPIRILSLVDVPMRDVNPTEVYAGMQAHSEQYLFIDVRTAAMYEASHAKGALNISIHDLYDKRFSLPKMGKTIVLICGDGKLAGVAYGYLERYGFRNLERIEGGLAGGKRAGLPTID